MEKTEGSGGGACLESSLAPAVGGRRWAVERLAGGEKGFLVEAIKSRNIRKGREGKGMGEDKTQNPIITELKTSS